MYVQQTLGKESGTPGSELSSATNVLCLQFGKVLWLRTLVCSSLMGRNWTDSILDHCQLSRLIVHIPSSWFPSGPLLWAHS